MKDGKDYSELVDGYCSGSLSDQQFAELEDALREDPALRRDLLESRMLESDLRQVAWSLEQQEQQFEQAPRSSKAFLGLRAEVWAAAAAIAVLLLGWQAFSPNNGAPDGSPVAEGGEVKPEMDAEVSLDMGVAVLARESSARWENHNARAGESMPPGRWNLVSGTAEIQFYSGASVTLQAPAELEILSKDGGILHKGRLRADVPPHAHGFSIKTNTVELVDLGTAFGMSVGDDRETEVHVFDGEVELFDPGVARQLGEGELLVAGQGKVFRNSGENGSLTVDPSLFAGAAQLDEQTQKEFLQWRDFSDRRAYDPRLLARYDFEINHGSRRGLGVDSSVFPYEILEGVIIGAQWGEGRWAQKGALDFKRPSDRVRVMVPGTSRSLTMVASLRIEGLDNFYNSILLSDGWNRPGALHWQILRNKRIELAFFHGEGDSPELQVRAPIVLEPSDLGRWMQFAVVFDGERGVVTHYQGGAPIGDGALDHPVPVEIGFAEIGNWTPPADQAREVRNFNGRIDEILIFDEVLSPEEIASFNTGAPIDPVGVQMGEGISRVEALAKVAPGATTPVTVNYRASEARKIELSFTLNAPPWTGFGSAAVEVPAGEGTVVVEVPIDAATPLGGGGYKFEASLIPVDGDFEDRIDSRVQKGVDCER